MADARIELAETPSGDRGRKGCIPAPLPPDDPEAWYAPEVEAQYEVYPGVVVTISHSAGEFRYDVREPALTTSGRKALERIEAHFEDAHLERPRTREGAIEVMSDGFAPKYERVIDELVDCTYDARRRIGYHALASLACLGELTPYALDEEIEVADAGDEGVVVHTSDYAPAVTALPDDPAFLGRFASERLDRYTVRFHEFEIPVIRYRENLLGNDPFTVKYAVREPDLLPGDEELIDECKERIWETAVDGIIEDETQFVRERAERLLARRLRNRNTRAWMDTFEYRFRSALAEYGVGVPPVDRRYADDRLSDLVYYILRDYVGYGELTVPIRDPNLEDIEANRVGERIKVVPRDHESGARRIPADLTFEDEQAFVNVVTQLAAADGTELNASNPSAKVNLSPEGVEETIRCAVALPTISEDGPHISIRKQSADVLTPVDLVQMGSISTEVVALLWLCYEHGRVVLFSGPTGVGKTTLMNAHMPFIPFDRRPISIDEGSREVRLPHETGVSLTTRDHEADYKQVTMADLMTQANYLNPDVEVIAEINTQSSFETFAETLNTGHGVIGTTHAEDVETLVNRVIEQGLPPYLLREIDLLVFPRQVGGKRYVGEVVELLSGDAFRRLDEHATRGDRGGGGTIGKGDHEIHWNTIAWSDADRSFRLDYEHPQLEGSDPRADDDRRRVGFALFDRLARVTDRDRDAVEAEFHRKRRYVKYLQREGITDFDALFGFLADLQTDEAATVARARDGPIDSGPVSSHSGSVGDDSERTGRQEHERRVNGG